MKRSILAVLTTIAMLVSLVVLAACAADDPPPAPGVDAPAAATPAPGADPAPVVEPTPEGAMTEWGTLRRETLIVEYQFRPANPGRFNPHMSGTARGTGVHQFMWSHLWDVNTSRGEQFPEIAAGFPVSNALRNFLRSVQKSGACETHTPTLENFQNESADG